MKICFFGTYYRSYSRNSVLADGLEANGVNVVHINKDVPKEPLESVGDFTLVKSIKRIIIKIKTSVSFIKNYRDIKQADAVLVLHPGHLDLPIAWLLTKLARKPLIFDAGMSLYDVMFIDKGIAPLNSFKARLILWLEKILLKLPNKLMVDTVEMKQFIVQTFGIKSNNVFVVPIGANEKLYKPAKKAPINKKTQVFFFGLYNPLQGAPVIIRAAKLLRENNRIQFTMLGNGTERSNVEAFAKKHKLGNVKFVDFVPETELVGHIQQADIMLGVFGNRPITDRVIPNKVFAGLACAKPVITANASALTTYLTHKKDIYIVNLDDPKSLAVGIEDLSANSSLRNKLSANGYQTFKNKFSDKVLGKIVIKSIK